MNLAKFQSKKIASIVLLLACVFISLLLSDIPYLVQNFFPINQSEGMSTNNDSMLKNIIKINKVTDTSITTSDKLTLIRKNVNSMDEGSDEQKKLLKILDDINSKDSTILANVISAAQKLLGSD